MNYNLLQRSYDRVCDRFTRGEITLLLFQKLESIFVRDSYLFTVNLN